MNWWKFEKQAAPFGIEDNCNPSLILALTKIDDEETLCGINRGKLYGPARKGKFKWKKKMIQYALN